MKKEFAMLREFHEKYQVEISERPTLLNKENSLKRYKFMREEVEEYLEGVEAGDLPNVAKELCDILYTTYGTIVAHGLQDKIESIFAEVHQSNMTKESHPYKIKKGRDYQEPNIDKYFK
jgi:predicted HAD superfamily Cof-like phosphohydrolase